MAMLYKYIYINNQRVNPPKKGSKWDDCTPSGSPSHQIQSSSNSRWNLFRIAISLVQGLRGKCEAIQYWIQSIRALQPQNITCSQQKIFSIYKPYHRSSTSLYSSLVGVSVSLGFFLTSFNVPLPNELYTVLHPFTSIYIHLHQFTSIYIHLHPFTSIYYIVYTCCFCSLEVTSTKTIPVVWGWHLWTRQPWRLPPPGAWEKGLLPPRPPSPGGLGSFFWGVTSITSVFLKALELVFWEAKWIKMRHLVLPWLIWSKKNRFDLERYQLTSPA